LVVTARALILALLLCLSPTLAFAAKSVAITVEHRGIRLAGVSLPAAGDYDVDLVAVTPAIENIKQAIDRIYTGSPFSAKRIDTLKKNGQVTLVYDAAFPQKKMASVVIAAFFPDFFQADKNGRKEFVVVVGRFGVKWPTDKLAAVIVHELVGHGLQHLRGRTENDRKIDKECEALIYEEHAYQDFGVRRDTRDMQQLRRDMRNNYCTDFRHFLTQKGLNADKVWNYGKPDVPKLLVHFEAYIQNLRKTGVSGKAVAAAKATRAGNQAANEKAAEAAASAPDMFRIGGRYLKGLGVKRDPKKGALWISKAANLGHAQAQHVMGALHASGFGVKKDPIEAYKWLSLAANRGFPKAKAASRKIKAHLTPAQLATAKQRIAAWRVKKPG
jgi:hypothetical protein